MNSPRYGPAGLLVEFAKCRVMLDGGPGAVVGGKLDAWLVTDEQGELMRDIRKLAKARGVEPRVATYASGGLTLRPRRVVHTSHPTFGYLLKAGNKRVAWAPEFFTFPSWAKGTDLMFAEAAGWNRPIHFARGTGGHSCVLDIAREAQQHHVRRLVFAHIGRPTIRAIDAKHPLPFGEFGIEGRTYRIAASNRSRSK
jgi:hypothetical protein